MSDKCTHFVWTGGQLVPCFLESGVVEQRFAIESSSSSCGIIRRAEVSVAPSNVEAPDVPPKRTVLDATPKAEAPNASPAVEAPAAASPNVTAQKSGHGDRSQNDTGNGSAILGQSKQLGSLEITGIAFGVIGTVVTLALLYFAWKKRKQ